MLGARMHDRVGSKKHNTEIVRVNNWNRSVQVYFLEKRHEPTDFGTGRSNTPIFCFRGAA